MAFIDFIEPAINLIDLYQGFRDVKRGINLQNKSLSQNALGLTLASNNARAASEYNIELDRQDLVRKLDVFSRDIRNLGATQRGQMATTGASLSSKSFLALTNSSLDTALRQTKRLRDNQKLLAQQRRYQADLQQINTQNQLAAIDYQKELNKFRFQREQTSFFKSIGSTILGTVF